MQWLRSLVTSNPRRWLLIGKTVFLAGSILVLGAVFARAAMIAANGERVEAKLPPFQTLAQLYPQYPTWIVPEGPLGYSIAAVLVLAGMALVVVAGDAIKSRNPSGSGR